MSACIFCHQEGAELLLNRHGARAHQECFNADDDADQAEMFAAMATPAFAPEELEVRYLQAAPRLPPMRAGEARCSTDGCPNPARRAGLCWTCTRRAQREATAPRYGGKTIAELAREAGVSEKAIRWRIRKLGWRSDQLSLPRGARRAPELPTSA